MTTVKSQLFLVLQAGKALKENQLRQVVYGEAFLVPKKLKKLGKQPAVYFVRDADKIAANGKYIESAEMSELQQARVYVKEDDHRCRLEKSEGVWVIRSTAKMQPFYKCPHGTITPPSLNWAPATKQKSIHNKHRDAIKVRCLQPPTHNPLFLKLAMEELIAFGSYEALNSKIQEIASCGSIPTLLLLMLDRLETGAEDQAAVISIFSQIFCSKNGMMEQELCHLVGLEDGLKWNILFTPIKPFLVSRRGRYANSSMHPDWSHFGALDMQSVNTWTN